VHRLWAVVTAFVVGYAAWCALRTAKSRGARVAGAAVAAMLVTQLILGPTMVLLTFPLPLATAHNAVAALLLLSVVALARFLWPAPRSQ
jgi:cytochrome c oxidase assembly protein subunit 15